MYCTVEEVEGHVLKLWKVSRMDMGAYMCIARKMKIIFNLSNLFNNKHKQ